MSKQTSSDVCLICGDVAQGYNFYTLSCHSCKAFFRRNLKQEHKKYKCNFGGNCKIDIYTRKSCIKCRLNKCFAMGMKHDSDKYKELKMRKISLNNNTTDIKQGYKNNISKNTLTTCTADSTTQSRHNINNKTICINTCVTVIDGNNEVATFIPRPITDYLNTFNEREANKLYELMSATVVFTDNLDATQTKPLTCLEFNRYMARKVFQLDKHVHRLVKMCKSLTSFARIEETDRILLIKHGFLDLKLIRSLKYYDYKQGGWAMNMEDGNTKVVSIESTKLLPNNAYIFYRQFFNDISQEWESDPIILDLLTAIILFNPDRPKLVNSTMIKFQQHKYMYLLQRYLLMRYKYHDMMRSKFTKLIQYATDVAILTQINQHIFKNVGPQHVSQPILREMLDII